MKDSNPRFCKVAPFNGASGLKIERNSVAVSLVFFRSGRLLGFGRFDSRLTKLTAINHHVIPTPDQIPSTHALKFI
jgi:hypothetical protein